MSKTSAILGILVALALAIPAHAHAHPEAHAQRAKSGQSHGTHREVGVIPIELEPDRRGRLVAVAHRERIVRLLQQRHDVQRQQLRFVRRGHHTEASAIDRAERLHLVEQVERVLVPQVERIERERPFQRGAPGIHLPDAQLVRAQHPIRRHVQRVVARGALRQCHRFGVPTLPHRRFGQLRVERRRRRLQCGHGCQ